MSNLGDEFKIDFDKAISDKMAIFKGNNYRITILSEILIRLEYDEEGYFEDRPTEFALNRKFEVPNFQVKEDNKFLSITTKYFKLSYSKEKPIMGSKIAPDANLKIELVNTDKLWFFNQAEARNFLSTATNIEDKSNKGLYSTDGFASIDDSQTLIFDEEGILRKPDRKRVDTYVFMYRRDFGYALRDYFLLSGKPPLIPRYALGIWWNKNEAYSANDAKNLLKTFNRQEIPLSVLLLGNKWHAVNENEPASTSTGFTFNNNLFPEPSELIRYMHERGVRVGIDINPSGGIMKHETGYQNVLSTLGLAENNTIPFNVFDKYIILTYFRFLIKPLTEYGIDFYWLNYYKKDDIDTLKALNYYHYQNSNANSNKRGLILSRNGLVAGHRYPVHYSGETQVDWKTLESLPYFNSRSSNIGISWWSHDIGGYKDGIEDSELYLRYVQLGAYSPIFRFASKEGHYYKREPWLWDIKTASIAREYCNLRHRLIPYLYTEAYKYSKTGLPLVQPLYYLYPETYDEPKYKNEYYFGTELFVAPITSKKNTVMNRNVHRIFLPNGMWYDFKTGKKFPGNKRYVTFFKDEDYPVFAKSGSIIPLADLEANKNVTNPPKSMEIHVFPGRSNIYNLYEDDGYTSLYKEGYFILTQIEYNYLANNYTLIIRPVEGKSGIIPAFRDYRIRFRNTKLADDVIAYLADEKVEINTYEDDTDFIVEIKDIDTTKQLTINCKGKDIEIDAVRLINEDIDSIISDLQIETNLKEKIAEVIFSELEMKKKRIALRKIKRVGLESRYIRMFIKLLEYIAEI